MGPSALSLLSSLFSLLFLSSLVPLERLTSRPPCALLPSLHQRRLEMADVEPKQDSAHDTKEAAVAPSAAGSGQQPTAGISQPPPQTYNIFVGDLPHNITESQMRDHFCKFGDIRLVNIIRDKITGLCKGTTAPPIPSTAHISLFHHVSCINVAVFHTPCDSDCPFEQDMPSSIS